MVYCVESVQAITWTTIDLPGYEIKGISGSKIVTDTCIYDIDSRTWGIIVFPGASVTSIEGIDGDIVVGSYGGLNPAGVFSTHGFIYDGTNWVTYDFPGASKKLDIRH